jgi:hypothetical protein
VCLDFSQAEDKKSSRSRLLADLLEPGIQQSGWDAVAKLVLKVRRAVGWVLECPGRHGKLLTKHRHHSPCLQGPLGTSTPTQLAATAFPALQHLELVQVSLEWEDLRALTSCSQLSSLHITKCVLPAAAPATNPLVTLASLKELHVTGTSTSLARGLTQLTSLCLHSDTETLLQLIKRVLDGMQQLQQLDLGGPDNNYEVPAAVMEQLFSAAPHLTGLTLGSTIRQPAFDALLAHGTQLTRLTCSRLDLSEDKSQSACSLKELVVTGDCRVWQMLAILPLHSLSRVYCAVRLRVQPFEIPSARPSLFIGLTNSDNLVDTTAIQAALTNLGTCPAWQDSGPSVDVSLTSLSLQTVEQHLPVVSALAALANKEVQLEFVSAAQLQVAGDIIQHLGATLGHRLTHLSLIGCTILHGFWPAMWRHLPGLQELSLWNNVAGAVSSKDIAAFCSHATRPLSLRLTTCLYSSVGPAEQLEQQCRTWGVPQVTVRELHA